MPKKKAKKSKKKSKPESGEDQTDLNIEGDGAQLGISKKKKGKKAKLTTEEKAAAKLDKQLESFLSDEKAYEKFLQKIDRWMVHNRSRVEDLFRHFDSEGDGIVPFEVFRAGLHDLKCPLTELEIHAFSRKLDPARSGMIEYYGFERGIHNRVIEDAEEKKEKMIPDDYTPEIYLTKQPMKNGLNDPYHQDYPRYAKLNMRLATFDFVAKHPGHFVVIVRTHMPVSVLIRVVGEKSRVTSGELRIYNDKACHADHRLPDSSTLEQCGVKGGPLRNPTFVTLYYDYIVEYSDCPLLNCDHYFGIEKRPLNPVLAAFPDPKAKKSNKKDLK